MKRHWIPVAVFFIFIINSCSKKDEIASNTTGFLSYSIEGSNARVNISSFAHIITITFPDSVISPGNLVADFTLSPGYSVSVSNMAQTSGVTANNYNTVFYYTISTSAGSSEKWTVKPRNNDYTYDWGLGCFLYKKASVDRTYNWYIDQMNTGFDAASNCGPSDVTMVSEWADSTFTKTAADARLAYEPNGGWWSIEDIDNYLSDNNVSHTIIALDKDSKSLTQTIEERISGGQIAIVNLDMNGVRSAEDPLFHTDKFYSTTPNWGHFLIIKGYTVVDNEVFYETYDSNSWGNVYTNGDPEGKDRYYRAEDIFNACNNWWQYIFIITKK